MEGDVNRRLEGILGEIGKRTESGMNIWSDDIELVARRLSPYSPHGSTIIERTPQSLRWKTPDGCTHYIRGTEGERVIRIEYEGEKILFGRKSKVTSMMSVGWG